MKGTQRTVAPSTGLNTTKTGSESSLKKKKKVQRLLCSEVKIEIMGEGKILFWRPTLINFNGLHNITDKALVMVSIPLG